jgi:hypothetical protein
MTSAPQNPRPGMLPAAVCARQTPRRVGRPADASVQRVFGEDVVADTTNYYNRSHRSPSVTSSNTPQGTRYACTTPRAYSAADMQAVAQSV